MAEKRKQLLHVKSSQVNADGSPKIPSYDTLSYGEIAINFAQGREALSIRNSADEVITIGNEVVVGSSEPIKGSLAEIFIDESVDPVTVDVYTKEQVDTQVSSLTTKDNELENSINSKVSRGDETTNSSTQLLVDESSSSEIEVYTKQEVNDLFLKLKQLNPSLNWE
jgi:hypothetical protein